MPKLRFLLEYDGTDFAGWQLQPAPARTVQGCLGEAIRQVTGRQVVVTGSGRTDAGVHAEGQVASAAVETELAPAVLREALNANLPRDVAVLAIDPVPADFDARFSARSKLYRYAVWNGPVRAPLRERRSWWVRGALDLAAMQTAAAALEGRRDFACFQAAGSEVKTSERTLLRTAVLGAAGVEVALELEGSGFLRHMVRNIAGTLVQVGLGRRPADAMSALLASRDRRAAGPTAPAHGLTLVAVRYDV